MNRVTQKNLQNLWSKDRELQSKAFLATIVATDVPVDWAYDIWDELVKRLTSPDNHDRAIAAQVLCNLAKSDPKQKMKRDFPALLNVTRDERFVTARHCMQALWKVGVVGEKQQKLVMDGLASRFNECVTEKNCTLIRYDILVGMKQLYDQVKNEKIKGKALELIATEQDAKYRIKYSRVWKPK